MKGNIGEHFLHIMELLILVDDMLIFFSIKAVRFEKNKDDKI
jgi:hypothetical protein